MGSSGKLEKSGVTAAFSELPPYPPPWRGRSTYENMGIECLLDLKLKSKISVNAELSGQNSPVSWGPLVTRVWATPALQKGGQGSLGFIYQRWSGGGGWGGGVGSGLRWTGWGKGHSSFL